MNCDRREQFNRAKSPKQQFFVTTVPAGVFPGDTFLVYAKGQIVKLVCPPQVTRQQQVIRKVRFCLPAPIALSTEESPGAKCRYVARIPDTFQPGDTVPLVVKGCIIPVSFPSRNTKPGDLAYVQLPFDPVEISSDVCSKVLFHEATDIEKCFCEKNKSSIEGIRFQTRVPDKIFGGNMIIVRFGSWLVVLRISTLLGGKPGETVKLFLPFHPAKLMENSKLVQVPWRLPNGIRHHRLGLETSGMGGGSDNFFILRAPRDVPRGQTFMGCFDHCGILGLRSLVNVKKGQWVMCDLTILGKMKPPPHPMAVEITPSLHPWTKSPYSVLKGEAISTTNSDDQSDPPFGVGYHVLPVPNSHVIATPRFKHISKFLCGSKFGYVFKIKIPSYDQVTPKGTKQEHSGHHRARVLLLDSKIRVNGRRVMVVCPLLCKPGEYIQAKVSSQDEVAFLDYSSPPRRQKNYYFKKNHSNSVAAPSWSDGSSSTNLIQTTTSSIVHQGRSIYERLTRSFEASRSTIDDESNHTSKSTAQTDQQSMSSCTSSLEFEEIFA